MIDLAGTPVRHHVDVDATVERAFSVFTTMSSWWPPEHRLMDSELREVIIEPRVGGRCYQVGVDDAQCDWGRVLVWEPPRRLVVAWHLTSRFEFDPDARRASELEVGFEPLDERPQSGHAGAPVLRPPRPRRRRSPGSRRHAQRLVLRSSVASPSAPPCDDRARPRHRPGPTGAAAVPSNRGGTARAGRGGTGRCDARRRSA